MQTSISSERCAFTNYPRFAKTVYLPKRPKPQRPDGFHRGLLAAAGLALIWVALWWVLLQAYHQLGWATRIDESPIHCGPGRIEQAGACVLGEGIFVAPGRAGWTGR